MMRRLLSLLLITACVFAQAVLLNSAEASGDERIRYEFKILLLKEEQAASIHQKVTYKNQTGQPLSRLMFSLYPNVFRREATLPYDNASLEQAFPYGYVPGGIEFQNITANGNPVRWGVQGDNETFLRVEVSLLPDEACVIEFDYTLLLTHNRAFLGVSDTDFRLTAFYPSLCPFENGDFITNPITRVGEYLYHDPADFYAEVYTPANYEIAAGGKWSLLGSEGGLRHYTGTLVNAREFAMVVSRKFHLSEDTSASGIRVGVYGQNRGIINDILDRAVQTLDHAEAMIGKLPRGELIIALCDMQNDSVNASGLILIGNECAEADVAALVLKQYFADVCMPNPAEEAWMTEAIPKYMSLLMMEDTQGEAAFKKALNDTVLSSLTITLPSSLMPHVRTMYFATVSEYETVVVERGCAVMHELRLAMGRDKLIESISVYYEACTGLNPTAEDLISAMNRAAGGEWRSAVYSWLNSIGDYAGEFLDVYE